MSAPKLEPGQSLADCPATKEFRERHEQVAPLSARTPKVKALPASASTSY